MALHFWVLSSSHTEICHTKKRKQLQEQSQEIISFSTRDELTIGQLEAIQASLNSYLGYLGHYKSYKIIHKSLTGSAVFKHLYFASGYKSPSHISDTPTREEKGAR